MEFFVSTCQQRLEESQTNHINWMYSTCRDAWYVAFTMTPSTDYSQQSHIFHRFTRLSIPLILHNPPYITQSVKERLLLSNTNTLPFRLLVPSWRLFQQSSVSPDESGFPACCRIRGRIGIWVNRDFSLKRIGETRWTTLCVDRFHRVGWATWKWRDPTDGKERYFTGFDEKEA